MNPRAGDIGLTVITGVTGALIRVGQWLTFDGAPYQHAFLVTSDEGLTVEAMPGRDGVRRNAIPNYQARQTVFVRVDMDDATRWAVAGAGEAMLGTRYSYAQYPALGLLGVSEGVAKLTGRPRRELRPEWLTGYIADSGRTICSQAVDEAFHRAGVQLFDDDRAPGDVTPGDLWRHLTAKHIRFTP